MSNKLDLNTIVWKSEYNIGNIKIDNEHQKLFSLARKALALNTKQTKNQKDDLRQIIKELYAYVITHFTNEQEYMETINYPDLQNHKNIHQNILEMLNVLIKSLNTLKISEIEKKLFAFIEEYFIKHIIMEDKKMLLWNTPLDELRKSFGWKDSYSVGDERIDSEHKKLFEIAKEAFNIVDSTKRNYKIKEVIQNLYSYMQAHFRHEEEYMLSINYPQIEEHKNKHQEIIENINEFVKKIALLDTELFEKELAKLIDIALVQHIIQEDRKIITFVRTNTE